MPVLMIRDVDRDSIISSICLHYTILVSKAELDDMIKGLKSLDVLSLLRRNPAATCDLFLHKTMTPLTAESLYSMFTAILSPQMSNYREKEESQLMN